MTSLSINCNMPPPDWSSIQEGKGGGEGGQTSRHGAEREGKNKNKKRKIKNKIEIKAKQIQKKRKYRQRN